MVNIKDLLIYKVLREIYHWLFQPFIDLTRKIKNTTKDHFCEKRLGIRTTGCSPVKLDITMFKDSAVYAPTSYGVIENMLEELHFNPEDVFVDLGCGKGRVIFSVAARKLKKVIGVEARMDMFQMAGDNLKNLKLKNTPVEIFNEDAAAFDMREGTIFFMFSPFGKNTQIRALDNIKKSLKSNPRSIRIVCHAGPDLDMLNGCDWLVRDINRIAGGMISVWRSKA